MDDLISRAAAIDALTDTNLKRNLDSVCDGDMNRTRRAAHRVIAQLPAVEVPLRCHGCSFFVPHKHDRGDDSRCTMLNREVRENDYCAFGAWTPKE